MAIKLTNREYCACMNDYKCEYICDTDDDFKSLPSACTGSTAVSIKTGAIRAVNTKGEWVAFAEE
mgnify:CR=1 FL=1